MMCGFWFHSNSRTIYLLTGDGETKLTHLTLFKRTVICLLLIDRINIKSQSKESKAFEKSINIIAPSIL
jgi:hypothetical protein